MAYPQQTKEYAKKLYLTTTTTGKPKYAYKDIASKIRRICPKSEKLSYKTVKRWALDRSGGKSWFDLRQDAVARGVTSESVPLEDRADEQQVLDDIMRYTKLTDGISKSLIIKGYTFFKDKSWEPKNSKEAIAVTDLGLRIREALLAELGVLNKQKVVNFNFNQTNNNNQGGSGLNELFDDDKIRKIINERKKSK